MGSHSRRSRFPPPRLVPPGPPAHSSTMDVVPAGAHVSNVSLARTHLSYRKSEKRKVVGGGWCKAVRKLKKEKKKEWVHKLKLTQLWLTAYVELSPSQKPVAFSSVYYSARLAKVPQSNLGAAGHAASVPLRRAWRRQRKHTVMVYSVR